MARPTKYRKEFVDMLPDLMKNGEGVCEVCVKLGISRDTFFEWVKVHKPFSDAYTRARILCQAWWEKQGRAGLYDRFVTEDDIDPETKKPTGRKKKTHLVMNSGLWAKNVSCRFPDDWRDKQAIEHSGGVSAVHVYIPDNGRTGTTETPDV